MTWPGSPTGLVLAAARFAAEKHRDQRRKDKDASPYINHPLQVAHTLFESGVEDPEVLAGALLHDTVEDTDTTLDELRDRFGPRIASLVAEVTDDKSLPKARRKELQVAHAAAASPGAQQIKIADKISNIRDITGSPPAEWDRERKAGYLDWAVRVVEGCRGVNPTLERVFDHAVSRARAELGLV